MLAMVTSTYSFDYERIEELVNNYEFAKELGFELGSKDIARPNAIVDNILLKMNRHFPVLMDEEHVALTTLGVKLWPSVFVIDTEQYIVKKMALALGSGPMDGVVFKDPYRSIVELLDKLSQ